VYKQTSKKKFIRLREGLREIREIVLNPMNGNNEELIQKMKNVVYLQLKEE